MRNRSLRLVSDWWHYFVNCTAVGAQREELILQLQTAADVRSQDSAATHWLQAASTLRGALPRSAVVETALKRALAVGVESTATSTSFNRRALVGAADKVAEAVLSLVREAKAINEVLGGRATASHQAASQLRAGFGRWAERTTAVGPGTIAIALLREARAEIAARAGDLYVTNGAYPEPAILRAVLALPARGVTPAGNSGALEYRTTSLRAALILRAAWSAAREDALDLARLPGARAQSWLLVGAWRRLSVFGPVRPAQTAHAVAATITTIIDAVSGGSSAHVSDHAARPAPAQAAHPSASTTGSSSSHAALPAPPATSTDGSASNLSAVGERAALQPEEVAERGGQPAARQTIVRLGALGPCKQPRRRR